MAHNCTSQMNTQTVASRALSPAPNRLVASAWRWVRRSVLGIASQTTRGSETTATVVLPKDSREFWWLNVIFVPFSGVVALGAWHWAAAWGDEPVGFFGFLALWVPFMLTGTIILTCDDADSLVARRRLRAIAKDMLSKATHGTSVARLRMAAEDVALLERALRDGLVVPLNGCFNELRALLERLLKEGYVTAEQVALDGGGGLLWRLREGRSLEELAFLAHISCSSAVLEVYRDTKSNPVLHCDFWARVTRQDRALRRSLETPFAVRLEVPLMAASELATTLSPETMRARFMKEALSAFAQSATVRLSDAARNQIEICGGATS